MQIPPKSASNMADRRWFTRMLLSHLRMSQRTKTPLINCFNHEMHQRTYDRNAFSNRAASTISSGSSHIFCPLQIDSNRVGPRCPVTICQYVHLHRITFAIGVHNRAVMKHQHIYCVGHGKTRCCKPTCWCLPTSQGEVIFKLVEIHPPPRLYQKKRQGYTKRRKRQHIVKTKNSKKSNGHPLIDNVGRKWRCGTVYKVSRWRVRLKANRHAYQVISQRRMRTHEIDAKHR